MSQEFIPFSRPDLDGSELEEIRQVLESGWLTTGSKVLQFELEFAQLVGARFGVAVNSCTAALHLSLEAVGLRRGEKVLTTPYTFAATAEVIRYFDAEPVFVDVDARTLNLDPGQLEQAIERENGQGSRLRAILPVHLAGHPCRMDALLNLARKHGLAVVEDAAHAFPASWRGEPIGSAPQGPLPRLACFSFYATKTITTGEGGMITTGDEALAERCRLMSLHGISRSAWDRYRNHGSWYYEILEPGFKYNLSDLAAAVGLAQLRRAEAMRRRRRQIAAAYDQAFGAEEALQIPHCEPDVEHAWHLYPLRLHQEFLTLTRDEFVEALRREGIGTSVHFIPLHLHPYYRRRFGFQPEDFPVAYREYLREVSLPLYSSLGEGEVERVIQAVLKVIRQHRRTRSYAVAGS